MWGRANRCWDLAQGDGETQGVRGDCQNAGCSGLTALQAVEAANNRNDIFIARFMSWAITYQSLSWCSRVHLVFQTCSFCASGSWAAAA